MAVMAGEERFLVDCGEGTQRQILRSGLGFKKLNRILLTHPHLDHILGLGGLVSTFTRWENMDEITIWGSEQTLERVQILIDEVVFAGQRPPIPIHYQAAEQGDIYQGKGYQVRSFPVQHRGRGCYGYLFQENDHRPFLSEKAQALGIPNGPERARLVRGEAITLADGTVISPEMVLGETETGVRVLATGDVGNLEPLRALAKNADVLITEATFLAAEQHEANQYGHITARQAAEFAQEMGVRYLVLTHVSRRYREYDIIHEAQQVFPNTIVARDLDHYRIRRGGALERVIESTQN